MICLVATLMILGAVLTLGGLGWGAKRLITEHRTLAAKLDEVTAIHDPALSDQENNARRAEVLPPTSQWGDLTYFREWVRRFILEQAVTNLGWPAAFTALGVVLSTVGGVWALWAPSTTAPQQSPTHTRDFCRSQFRHTLFTQCTHLPRSSPQTASGGQPMNTRAIPAICLLAVGLLTITACGGSTGSTSDSGKTADSGSNAASTKPVDAAAAWKLIHAAVPTSGFSMTVTAANDGNHLLGRPHEYTSAIKFTDSRVKASDVAGDSKGDIDYGGGIEVFTSHSDAQARADYIQTVTKKLPMFSEYDYVSGKFLVRISHYLTPAQAEAYKAAASKLG